MNVFVVEERERRRRGVGACLVIVEIGCLIKKKKGHGVNPKMEDKTKRFSAFLIVIVGQLYSVGKRDS